MGHVSAPFGIQGWIKIHPYTETNTGLTNYTSWWLGKNSVFQTYEVLEARAQGTEVVARLKGFDDREGALTLRGMEVAIPRSELPNARRDEYYWSDLIGLTVLNAEGVNFGAVKSLLETGANDVLVVGGEKERLIPFVRQVILKVDLQGGTIQVDWGADY